jgi:hypothetical protein
MKQKDVVIGETYSTKVGPVRVRVVVVSKVEAYGSHNTRFIVRRVSEDKPLPKPRTAAALRPIKVKSATDVFSA